MIDQLSTTEVLLILTIFAGFILSKADALSSGLFGVMSLFLASRISVSSLSSNNEFDALSGYLHNRLKTKPHYSFINGKIAAYPKGYWFFMNNRLCYAKFRSETLNSGTVENKITVHILFASYKHTMNFINNHIQVDAELNQNEYIVGMVNGYRILPDKKYCNDFDITLCNQKNLQSLYDGMDSMMNRSGVFKNKSYLLHGVSGSGKSHIVTHLASKYKANLYVIVNVKKLLNVQDMIESITTGIKKNSILLIEECDTLFADENISLFLNILDGVAPIQNAVVIMTTNAYEKIDKRLIRKGRMQCLEFTQKDVDRIQQI